MIRLAVRLLISKRGRVVLALTGGLFLLMAGGIVMTLRTDYLLWCVDKGDVSQVRRLLKSGVSSNSADPETHATPLMGASASGNIEMVELLLNYGADPNAHDYYHGNTPLLCAVVGKHPQIVDILLAHGADPNDAALSKFEDKHDDPAYSLLLATESHDTEMVQVLLRHGASVKVRDSTGQTALDIAIQGHDGTLKQILRQAAQAQKTMQVNR